MAEKAEATVVFGVLNETSEHESRVALTPDIVTRLRKSGVTCLIESGAGVASHYVDEDYTKAGAQVVSADDVIARADALGFVDRPSNELLARVKQGTWIIGMLGSFTDADYVAAIEKAGLVGVAMEKLPRQLSSAQSMDEMTSQNSVMGYKAAIVAANAYGSFLPMMTTAAGTIRPAKVLILGAGIAGLQAIGTAKRLGAVVTAYDVRPASKGEVESLGAKFLDLGLDFSKGQGEGGYARALSAEEIHTIVDQFRDAAWRAMNIGFDAVEVHAAHGYLLSQFLDQLINERDDEYGGSFDNRVRMLVEVVDAIRSVVPDTMPVLVRVSATDWAAGGWDLDQTVELAKILKAHGVDLIDVSTGGLIPDVTIPVKPDYQVPFAEQVRSRAGIPTTAVGLITKPKQAKKILKSGAADAVEIGRAALRDPYWPLRAAHKLDVPVEEAPYQPPYLRGAFR